MRPLGWSRRDPMSLSTNPTGAVQSLVSQRDAHSPAFQSVLAIALQAVSEVLAPIRLAETAALSLAQQEHAAAAIADLEALERALRNGLDAQGRCLVPEKKGVARLREKVQEALDARHERDTAPSWWCALAGATEALDTAAKRLRTLAQTQPPGSPAGRLSRRVAIALRAHHDRLVGEARYRRAA